MWVSIGMAVLGLWLMVSPGVMEFEKHISNNAHIVGPLIVTFSIIAIFDCTRNVRYANLPLAIWLLAAPWILQYDNSGALLNDYGVSILIILLSLLKSEKQYRFGGGWPAVWRADTLHAREAGNPQRVELRRNR